MPPRKRPATASLESKEAKIGRSARKPIAAAKAVSDDVVADLDPRREIEALRGQMETLRLQLAEAAQAMKSGAKQTARQTEATVKLYPVSALVTVAAVVGAFAFMVASARSAPPRSRYHRTLDDVRDFYGRARERFS